MALQRLWGAAGLALVALLLTATPLALESSAQQTASSLRTTNGVPVPSQIAAIWQATDGQVVAGRVQRDWLWGPSAMSTSVEYSADSPSGERRMVYFDKARLDILDPNRSQTDAWYVTGALLVTQMLAGSVGFAGDAVVRLGTPQIAAVGDPIQPTPLTYAGLAQVATVLGVKIDGTGTLPIAAAQVGAPVTAMITGDGSVTDSAADANGMSIGAYDEITGHNIAQPFANWTTAQQYPAAWLIGRPLTEPYWLDTVVAGKQQRVLVQAFERRVLTWTPGRSVAAATESNNAGAHYRAWRGLETPADGEHVSLASYERFGEELVAAAVANNVDPLLLTAVAQAVSAGDPRSATPMGGRGLLGVDPAVAGDFDHGLLNPRLNAELGAAALAAALADAGGDVQAALVEYFGGHPELVANTQEKLAALAAKHPMNLAPSPVGPTPAVEPPPPVATPAPDGRLGRGAAAYYAAGYDVAWWERTLRLYDSWGTAIKGWQNDPNGYYCVHPDFRVGERLLLRANGVELTCTIGDSVQTQHQAQWRAKWVVELSWPTFKALGLDRSNTVEVFRIQ